MPARDRHPPARLRPGDAITASFVNDLLARLRRAKDDIEALSRHDEAITTPDWVTPGSTVTAQFASDLRDAITAAVAAVMALDGKQLPRILRSFTPGAVIRSGELNGFEGDIAALEDRIDALGQGLLQLAFVKADPADVPLNQPITFTFTLRSPVTTEVTLTADGDWESERPAPKVSDLPFLVQQDVFAKAVLARPQLGAILGTEGIFRPESEPRVTRSAESAPTRAEAEGAPTTRAGGAGFAIRPGATSGLRPEMGSFVGGGHAHGAEEVFTGGPTAEAAPTSAAAEVTFSGTGLSMSELMTAVGVENLGLALVPGARQIPDESLITFKKGGAALPQGRLSVQADTDVTIDAVTNAHRRIPKINFDFSLHVTASAPGLIRGERTVEGTAFDKVTTQPG